MIVFNDFYNENWCMILLSLSYRIKTVETINTTGIVPIVTTTTMVVATTWKMHEHATKTSTTVSQEVSLMLQSSLNFELFIFERNSSVSNYWQWLFCMIKILCHIVYLSWIDFKRILFTAGIIENCISVLKLYKTSLKSEDKISVVLWQLLHIILLVKRHIQKKIFIIYYIIYYYFYYYYILFIILSTYIFLRFCLMSVTNIWE